MGAVNGLGGGNAVVMDAVPPEAQPAAGAPLLELEELLRELLEELLELLELDELLLELLLELELELPPPQPKRPITGTDIKADPMTLTKRRRTASGVVRILLSEVRFFIDLPCLLLRRCQRTPAAGFELNRSSYHCGTLTPAQHPASEGVHYFFANLVNICGCREKCIALDVTGVSAVQLMVKTTLYFPVRRCRRVRAPRGGPPALQRARPAGQPH